MSVSQIVGEMGVLVISETMLEDSFLLGRSNFRLFLTPIMRDNERLVGGLLLVLRKDIPTKNSLKEIATVECGYVELNLRKKSWL